MYRLTHTNHYQAWNTVMSWWNGRLGLSTDDLLFRQNFLRAMAEELGGIRGLRATTVVDDQDRNKIGTVKLVRPGITRMTIYLESTIVLIDGFDRDQSRFYEHYDLSDPSWLDKVIAYLSRNQAT